MREKVTTLNSKKKRSPSSRAWLLRQLNDPYVEEAHQEGYRSRAAFKLREDVDTALEKKRKDIFVV
ncbi:hypothetical protein AGMMS49949_07780 [Alphaproteobacteria bacterium]|nr:hypothetical protein AGMMS49949_07780 [Alphaproteobacteria bacterium]GHS99002.1 hypothetical protein AGMMS50296_6950 [Alphaproteobacteria bacterium]